ncbi:hypothetical protein [uncultured Tateyamaria sp.]|uniref:hypothetical protein n=1 Tax=uncultured Tateyamaria sp. TaxID=455651 RepID=UPI00261D47AE|nr:hypothetical protein [uncultured Tateyamaria sp.]
MDRRAFLRTAAAAAFVAIGSLAGAQSVRRLPVIPVTDLTDGINGRIPLALGPGTHDFGTGTAS